MNAAATKALNTYRQTGIQTQLADATPHRIVQMLFEGALGRVAAARGCVERKNFMMKSKAISEAMAIIVGLRDTLDMEKGGQVAANLNDLYAWMTRSLSEANRTNETVLLDEVATLLGEIKASWDGIPDEYRGHPIQ